MTKKKQLGICQISGCPEEAEYGIYRTDEHGKKKWLYVCDKHDKEIAKNNIRRYRGVKDG